MRPAKILLSILAVSVFSNITSAGPVKDGSDIPSCRGVTDLCLKADVTATDKRTYKTLKGYTVGGHDAVGKGLWADCVVPLSRGEPVEGVSGVARANAAKCMKDFTARKPERDRDEASQSLQKSHSIR